jgi:hypothetical protein
LCARTAAAEPAQRSCTCKVSASSYPQHTPPPPALFTATAAGRASPSPRLRTCHRRRTVSSASAAHTHRPTPASPPAPMLLHAAATWLPPPGHIPTAPCRARVAMPLPFHTGRFPALSLLTRLRPLCPVPVPAADASPPSTRPRPRPSRSASAPTTKPCRARLRCGTHSVPYPHRCIAAAPFPRGDSMSTTSADHSVSAPIHVVRARVRVYAVRSHTRFALYPSCSCIGSALSSRPRPRRRAPASAMELRMRDRTRGTKLGFHCTRGRVWTPRSREWRHMLSFRAHVAAAGTPVPLLAHTSLR